MHVKVEPCKPDGGVINDDEDEGNPYDMVEQPKDLLGKRMDVLVTVSSCKGLQKKVHNTFSKVLAILTLPSQCTGPLTFENVSCDLLPSSRARPTSSLTFPKPSILIVPTEGGGRGRRRARSIPTSTLFSRSRTSVLTTRSVTASSKVPLHVFLSLSLSLFVYA